MSGVALLPARTVHLGDHNVCDAQLVQRRFHLVQFLRYALNLVRSAIASDTMVEAVAAIPVGT